MQPIRPETLRSAVVELLILILVAVTAGQTPLLAQDGPQSRSGLVPSGASIAPVFEGWYRNADGSFSLSFGYFSRNSGEALDIPLGPDNLIEPAIFDGVQPTRFEPQPQDRGPGRGIRHWGVFVVKVPPDFGGRTVVWTIRSGGEVHSVPGSISHPGYELDALRVDATGSTPPALRFEAHGEPGRGPGGIHSKPLDAAVGVPLQILVLAADDHAPPVVLHWFKHQGVGEVRFAQREVWVDQSLGRAVAAVTFDAPGRHVLRVRATNQATEFDRHCCWTNGYVEVNVVP